MGSELGSRLNAAFNERSVPDPHCPGIDQTTGCPMRISLFRFSLAAALGLVLATPLLPGVHAPAQAQSVQIGPGGVRIQPERDYRRGPRWRVSEREAVRIARRNGLVNINRVVNAGREWRVSGADRRGRFARIVIDARSGNVVRVVRTR